MAVPENPVPEALSQRYSIGRRLGRGGMATVYQATDRLLHREVAIKVFTARADSPEEIERQEAEARLIASLNHHALTTLFDAGVDATDPEHPQIYLVMEYIPGDDLHERLRRGPLDPLQLSWLGLDLAEGLEYVHANGFLHRDIKPANVLLASRDADTRLRGKLTDFGIASLLGSRDGEEHVTGTAAYLSPEQAEGDPPTAESDVYSLGLVLLEALTGQVAFPGGIEESAYARLERDPGIDPSIRPELAEVLRRMTARRPEDRIGLPAAAAAFQDVVIDDVIRRRGIGAPQSAQVEAARLAALKRYDILGTPPEASFDRVTRLASRTLHVPIALVSIVDVDRVWFKSRVGFESAGVDRNTAFCATTDPGQLRPWTVADARADPRTRDNPLVVGEPFVRSYAAAPLVTTDGHALGSLCVFDREPRVFTEEELATLQDLAGVVMSELELRLASRRALFER